MLRLYNGKTGNVEDVVLARADVIRVSSDGGLRATLVADLIRRLAAHHRLRTVGIWPPGTAGELAGLNVRPAEFAEGDSDVHLNGTVGACALASHDGLDPLAVRFALLTRHYRADVDLAPEDLAAADSALASLRRQVAGWAEAPGRPISPAYVEEAVAALDEDLATPEVFGVLARLAEDDGTPPGAKFETAIKLDMILGLDLVSLVGRL